jgi:hypothetical protein
MADVLPGYTYDPRLRRYRSNATGRLVSRNAIMDQLGRAVMDGRETASRLTTAFHEGRLSASAWQEQLRTTLRRMHSQHAALGIGGWDRMTPRDWGRIGYALREDYARVQRLAQAVQAGEVSLSQALQRADGYMGNARAQYYRAEQDRLQPSEPGNEVVSRRLLGAAEHCPDCLDYYARGWQPAGSLPVPTQSSQCGTYCQCDMVHREVPSAEVAEWIGTKRG